MENDGPRRDISRAAILLSGILFLFYCRYLPFPGSLYAQVVRQYWPIFHTWPYYELSKRIFLEGHFPLWNPLSAGGTPLLGCLQAAPFHPVRMMLYLFPFWGVIDLWLLLRVLISGMGTYWYMRSSGTGWQGAVFAACAWMLGGSITNYMNVHYLDVDLLLPFGLLAFGRMARGGRLLSVAAAALIVFLAFLGGNPSSALYFLMFVTLYYFYTVFRIGKDVSGALTRFMAAAALSGLLSAVVLLPFHELLAYSWDHHPSGYYDKAVQFYHLFHTNVRKIPAFFGPEIFSRPYASSIPLGQTAPYGQHVYYIGTVVLILTFPNLLFPRRMGSRALFLVAFILLFAGFLLDIKPFNALGLLPIFERASNFQYAMPEIAFCTALLAGISWDHLTRHKEHLFKYMVLPAAMTLTAALLMILKHKGMLKLPIQGVWLMIICAFAWSATFAALLQQKKSFGNKLAFALVLALWFMESFVHYNFLTNFTRGDISRWKTLPSTKVDLLAGKRFYAVEKLMYPNSNLAHGIEDFRYVGALYVDRYRSFMSLVNGHTPEDALRKFYPYNYISLQSERLESPLLDSAGIEFFITDKPLPPNRLMKDFLDRGQITAPRSNYVQKIRMGINSEIRDTLFQHPPSRLTVQAPKGELRFGIGIDPSSYESDGDGATFMILEHGSDSTRCVFSRHIDPAHNIEDRRWLDYTINIEDTKLSLLTISSDNFINDWSAWSDIRSSAVDLNTRYRLVDSEVVYTYRNPTVMPRAFVPASVVSGSADVCREAIEDGLNLHKKACVEGQFNQQAEERLSGSEKNRVDWRRVASDRVVVDTNLVKRSMVIVAETYYPGWKAFLENGVELPIHPANIMFRAVAVPAGKHRVTFVYLPASFRISMWTTLVSLLIFMIVCGKTIRLNTKLKVK